ncbi:MAG: Fic family protein [Thermodesulfobacteriota bacterium]|nr:Fic family protein [Thermodesulfobacteriota bacterium]
MMDKNQVRKVLTLKSGQFVFSRRFSEKGLSDLFIEARVLYRTVSDLPILPTLSTQLEEEIIRRSIFGTAALEGNPLTEEEVGRIISQSAIVKQGQQAEQEIDNLKVAYDFVAKQPALNAPLEFDEKLIKEIHEIITTQIPYQYNAPGKYRNHLVKVGDSEHGGVYTPPKCLPDIKTLMKEYVNWMNKKETLELTPLMRGALSHYHLALIHPFGDGNGRTARLVEALVMRSAGIKYVPIMLSNFYYRNIDNYFSAFSITRKDKNKDVTPFLQFVLSGVVDSLNQLKDRITYYIRKFSLRDFYAYLREQRKLTHRQHDLLIMLLESGSAVALNELFQNAQFALLYRNVSERTARRDLKKLLDEDLLTLSDKGRYTLNIRILDSLPVALL